MDFVTFETAKKLKGKGYPQHICDHAYITRDDEEEGKYAFGDREYIPFIPDYLPTIAAPIISQVLKWLREEKKLYIEPCMLADADTDADGEIINEYTYWNFAITNIETGDLIYFEKYEHVDFKRFDSYEQAALAGIEYCLDNLI